MYTINYDSLTSKYGVNGKGKIVDILAKNYDITTSRILHIAMATLRILQHANK